MLDHIETSFTWVVENSHSHQKLPLQHNTQYPLYNADNGPGISLSGPRLSFSSMSAACDTTRRWPSIASSQTESRQFSKALVSFERLLHREWQTIYLWRFSFLTFTRLQILVAILVELKTTSLRWKSLIIWMFFHCIVIQSIWRIVAASLAMNGPEVSQPGAELFPLIICSIVITRFVFLIHAKNVAYFRSHMLEASSDSFPTSLLLIEKSLENGRTGKVIGHSCIGLVLEKPDSFWIKSGKSFTVRNTLWIFK